MIKSNQEYIDDTSDEGYYRRLTNLKVIQTGENSIRLTDAEEDVATFTGKKGVKLSFDEQTHKGAIELDNEGVHEVIEPFLPVVTITTDESTGIVNSITVDGVKTKNNLSLDLGFMKTFVEENAPVKKITGKKDGGVIVVDSDEEAIISLDENYTIDEGEYLV